MTITVSNDLGVDAEGFESEELFEFWFDGFRMRLILHNYYVRKRKTRRHHFKAFKIWHRLDQRGNNTERPEVTDDVKARALSTLMSSIDFED